LFSKWEDFYIMDQHAVAERIIFEKMRNEYDPGNISLLSIPLTFEIKERIDERLKQIQKLGFDIDYFWQNKVIVYAVPAILEKYKVDISALINSLLYSNDNIDISYMLEQILATKSCKAAIKANHKLSFEEMKQLIEDGMKYINGFFVCQHGRPSVVKLSKQDIDSFFDRT
jgi:DNA mismatch repair protein MutL